MTSIYIHTSMCKRGIQGQGRCPAMRHRHMNARVSGEAVHVAVVEPWWREKTRRWTVARRDDMYVCVRAQFSRICMYAYIARHKSDSFSSMFFFSRLVSVLPSATLVMFQQEDGRIDSQGDSRVPDHIPSPSSFGTLRELLRRAEHDHRWCGDKDK